MSSAASIARIYRRAQLSRTPVLPDDRSSLPYRFISRLLSNFPGSDPGLLRLHTALRSAIACFLTGLATIVLVATFHQPMTLVAYAVLFAMVAPLFLRDANRRAWFRSLFVIFVAASASFVVASALARWPVVADAGFLAVLFIGVLIQACGPRALGGAMMSVVAFYLGLYLHPSFEHVAGSLVLSIIGVGMVVFAGRVLVPTHPASTLRRALHTVGRRAAAVLADRTSTDAAARRHLLALNEAALAVEDQLSLFSMLSLPAADRLRACLIDVEVAAARHAARGDADLLPALKRFLRASRSAVRALNVKRRALDEPRKEAGFVEAMLASRAAFSWLPACRATTAAFIAMLIGQSVSPERWFWAVMTTFVVFLGTRSRGDTIRKTTERVIGTVAGVIVSMAVVGALHGMPVLLVAVMIACVFGWAYFILTSYGQGVFFITVLVGLVYGELGFAIKPLIELRVEEVAVGCVVSIIVAIGMMPLRTSRHADDKVRAVLDALDDVLRAGAGDDAASRAPAAMRSLDRRWHELRLALRPLQTQQAFAWDSNVEQVSGSLFACVQAAREFARESMRAESVDRAGDNGTATALARERLAGALLVLAGRTRTPATHHHAIASGALLAVR
jgi:hypothetical protein